MTDYERNELITTLANALLPWVESHGGRLWIWPESAFETALKNSRAAIAEYYAAMEKP